MFKFVTILAFATFSCTIAAPKPSGVAVAPLAVAPAVVTAQSSQVIARNYNALAAPLVAAASVVRAAPLVASAPVLAPAPVFRAGAPLVAAPASYFSSPYLANPYAAPLVL